MAEYYLSQAFECLMDEPRTHRALVGDPHYNMVVRAAQLAETWASPPRTPVESPAKMRVPQKLLSETPIRMELCNATAMTAMTMIVADTDQSTVLSF